MISPPSILSDRDSPDPDGSGPNGSNRSNETASAAAGSGFPALRKALKDDSLSPDSVIRAAAESARAKTGAEGVAIALRARGAIVCRARSGDLAPEIGASLNAHSGFSGECLRTASVLLCQDAETDARVDPDVCRFMGIRSIVAVPLRGAIGIAGILEAFSSRPNAFGDEHINWLRELASVAEAAYEKERMAREEETLATLSSSRRLSALFSRPATSQPASTPSASDPVAKAPEEEEARDSFPTRKYWVVGVMSVALLLVLGIWLSWREPELAETAAAAKAASAPVQTTTPSEGAAARDSKVLHTANKPGAALNLVRPASNVERTSTPEPAAVVTFNPESQNPAASKPSRSESAGSGQPAAGATSDAASGVDAPPVTIADASPLPPISFTSSSTTMPEMAAPVSQGVTQAALTRKVDPIYPLQARKQRISGSVVLEITIAEDGTVRKVKKISGVPILVGAAVQAVSQWRYSPVLLNGKPIEAERQVSVVFRLPN